MSNRFSGFLESSLDNSNEREVRVTLKLMTVRSGEFWNSLDRLKKLSTDIETQLGCEMSQLFHC